MMAHTFRLKIWHSNLKKDPKFLESLNETLWRYIGNITQRNTETQSYTLIVNARKKIHHHTYIALQKDKSFSHDV